MKNNPPPTHTILDFLNGITINVTTEKKLANNNWENKCTLNSQPTNTDKTI